MELFAQGFRFKKTRQTLIRAATCAAILAATLGASPASAGRAIADATYCVRHTGGVFQNGCNAAINLYMPSGSLPCDIRDSRCPYGGMEIGPGDRKFLNAYQSSMVACPHSSGGRGVSLNPRTRRCEVN
jgi:hypothetical protein